jgi:hypothetical protein
MSAYTFKDNLIMQNNLGIGYLDSTGVSRANVIRVNTGTTYISASCSGPLYINNGITNATLFMNMSGGNPTIIRSRLGVGFETSTEITADITVNKGGFIGTNTTVANSFLGISSGYDMTSAAGSRITLYGNVATGSSGTLELYTGNNTQGSFKIFTGTESLKMQINNSGSSFFTPNGSNIVLSVKETIGSFNVPLLVADTTQSIGVGTGGSLTVNGGASITKDLYVGGTMTSSSDIRLKDNIEELTIDYLDVIESIRTVKFNYKNTPNRREYGFIAQDFETELPELIRKPDNGGYYTLDYQKTCVILLKCVKELNDKVKRLATSDLYV